MQQINLFQPIFRQPKPLFSAVALAQVWILIVLAMALLQGFFQWRVFELERRMVALASDRDVAERRFKELTQRLPKKQPDPSLLTRTQALEADLAQTRRIADTLSGGASGNTRGLSDYLLALARQHVGGTWLTRVEVAQGGIAVGLGGRARAPELVPEYIQKLGREPVFQGKSFSHFNVTRDEDDGIGFSLATLGLVTKDKQEAGSGEH